MAGGLTSTTTAPGAGTVRGGESEVVEKALAFGFLSTCIAETEKVCMDEQD